MHWVMLAVAFALGGAVALATQIGVGAHYKREATRIRDNARLNSLEIDRVLAEAKKMAGKEKP